MEKPSFVKRLVRVVAKWLVGLVALLVLGALVLLVLDRIPPRERPALRKIAADEPLYPVKIESHVGYIDRAGKLVLPPQAQHGEDFQGPTATQYDFGCVNILRRDYFCPIDAWPWNWKRLVGFAICAAHSGVLFDRWWLLDRSGRRVGGKYFHWIAHYGEGLYAVNEGGESNHHMQLDGGKWGYIDQQGKLVVPFQFNEVSEFAEGVASVRVGERHWFIDRHGKTIPFPTADPSVCNSFFCGNTGFSEGLALVSVGQNHHNADRGWAFVDHAGKTILSCTYSAVWSFKEGRAVVMVKKKWGYIDRAGRLVIPAVYDAAFDFHEGRAMVQLNRYIGFVDEAGNVVVPIIYSWATNYSEGLATVRLGNKSAVIDKRGNIVIPFRSWRIGPFIDGLSLVEIGGMPDDMAYVDRSGNYVWGPHLAWR